MELMNLDQFIQLILPSLKQRLEGHEGLPVFAQQRAKFEGWLKVELCGILLKHFPDTLPEKGRTDLTAGGWAIELKTFSTNYRHKRVVNKIRTITNNIAGVCKDIEKLRKIDAENKMVIFVVFPINEGNKGWFTLLNRIKSGEYMAATIHDYMNDIQSIGKTFKELLANPGIDPQGYCLEWYLSDKDMKCMVPLKSLSH